MIHLSHLHKLELEI